MLARRARHPLRTVETRRSVPLREWEAMWRGVVRLDKLCGPGNGSIAYGDTTIKTARQSEAGVDRMPSSGGVVACNPYRSFRGVSGLRISQGSERRLCDAAVILLDPLHLLLNRRSSSYSVAEAGGESCAPYRPSSSRFRESASCSRRPHMISHSWNTSSSASR